MSNECARVTNSMKTVPIVSRLRRKAWVLGISLSLLVALVGCGGGAGVTIKPNPTPAVAIAMGPGISSLDVGHAFLFSVSVSNTSNTAVTWAAGGVTGGNSTFGTISTLGFYTAPSLVPNPASVAIMATSQADSTKSATTSVTIIPQLIVTTTALTNGTAGSNYTSTLSATGGVTPYTWSIVTGSLPSGLSLNAATGAIAGALPSGPGGVFPITVKVTDSGTNPQQSQTFSGTINITPSVLTITTTSLVNGVVGTAYSAPVASVGGNGAITWSLTIATLPGGLNLGSSGMISGSPTTAGTSTFSVTATDSSSPPETATQSLSITINPLLAITAASLPNGVVGTAYSATLQSTGGVGTATWTVPPGALPAGLTLSSAGAISGTPTTAGASTFTVTAKDTGTPQQTVTHSLSITIYTGLTIITTSLPNGTVNSAYSAILQSGGGTGTVNWSTTPGTLPAGLILSSSGTISGKPTTAGSTSFTVTATDSGTPQQTKKPDPGHHHQSRAKRHYHDVAERHGGHFVQPEHPDQRRYTHDHLERALQHAAARADIAG